MTENQLKYLALQESVRSNRVNEMERARANRAAERLKTSSEIRNWFDLVHEKTIGDMQSNLQKDKTTLVNLLTK